jgi:3-phosphoshikimate 1-carboxyvinyltransferase
MNENMLFSPSVMQGVIKAPSSKSSAQRKLICAALASGQTTVKNIGTSEDVGVIIACLQNMGATINITGQDAKVLPINLRLNENKIIKPKLYCKESGAAFRFLLPVTAALFSQAEFYGDGELPNRPILTLVEALEEKGVIFTAKKLPFETKGTLQSGIYKIPADISSQYISGLLMALPLLQEDSEIQLTTEVQSTGYIEMTLQALREFDIQIHKTDKGYLIPGGQTYQSPKETTVEGDWSGSANFLVAGALIGPVTINGLDVNSRQPDAEILRILEKFGATITTSNNEITVQKANLQDMENDIKIDVANVLDLAPIIAIIAAKTKGKTVLINTARLRLKESNRVRAIQSVLQKFGVSVTVEENSITITGMSEFTGGEFDNFRDHRIAMAIAIGATVASEEVYMKNAQVIAKSYPEFYKDYKQLGGQAEYE